MKCEIIRDLLPSYCDGLTSEESNSEIEKHIEECDECKKIMEKMLVAEDNSIILKKEIEPLKKVRKLNVKKIIASCIMTALICTIAFLVCFWGVIPKNSEKVDIEIICSDEVLHEVKFDYLDDNNEPSGNVKETEIPVVQVTVKLKSKNGAIRIKDETKFDSTDGKTINIHPEFSVYSAFDVFFGQGSEYSYSINDPNKDCNLTIHFSDKDVTYNLHEIYMEYLRTRK